jgi:hypothetical protein
MTIFIKTYIFVKVREGRKEGRKEARKGGREEGRKGGREEGRKEVIQPLHNKTLFVNDLCIGTCKFETGLENYS